MVFMGLECDDGIATEVLILLASHLIPQFSQLAMPSLNIPQSPQNFLLLLILTPQQQSPIINLPLNLAPNFPISLHIRDKDDLLYM